MISSEETKFAVYFCQKHGLNKIFQSMGFEEDIKAGFKCYHCEKTFGIASNRYYLDKPLARHVLQNFTGIGT